LAHPHNRVDYLKMVLEGLRRYNFPLGDFYVKLALRRLRDAVYLTPTEAAAIWAIWIAL
jgi:hypothetical protein